MTSVFASENFPTDGSARWSDVAAAVDRAIQQANDGDDLPFLMATARELLALKIDEPAHSAKVKKARIAAALLDALEAQDGFDRDVMLPELFQLSAWTPDSHRTAGLGLELKKREGHLTEDDWDHLINALMRISEYETVVRLSVEQDQAVFAKQTLSRIEKSRDALALRDIRIKVDQQEMPEAELFDQVYSGSDAELARALVQTLLEWQSQPEGAMPIPDIALREPDTQPGTSIPLFCSGFRWSGASAVYDFVTGLDAVGTPTTHPRMMSGGRAPLERVLDQVFDKEPVDPARVSGFVLEKILGLPYEGGGGKIADIHRRSILGGRKTSDPTDSIADLLRVLRHYSDNNAKNDRVTDSSSRLRDVFARIEQDPPTATYTAFDSVMRAWRPEFVTCVEGARMIAVIRDPRDMYVTYLRMERPRLGAGTFIRDFGERIKQFQAGLAKLPDRDARFRLVRFEDFVLNPQLRQDLCDWLGVENTADIKNGSFIPEQSAKNIGVYKDHDNQDAIQAIEAAFPEWCYSPAIAAKPAASRWPATTGALHVLSFSAMASKPMMEDVMSLSGRKGDPGWAIRKGITGDLIAQGRYDFVGLQHAHFDSDVSKCGVQAIRDEANERAEADYAVLNADDRFGVESGDSLPIYYDTTKWDLVPEANGVEWFSESDARSRRIGGGRFFVYGLFRRKTAPGPNGGPDHVWVYNLRLRHKSSDELDQRRTRNLTQIMTHIDRNRSRHPVPVVILADTNIKELDAKADQYLNGKTVTLDGETLQSPVPLQDAFLDRHPQLLGKVTSQHNFAPAGKTEGTGRNDRILVTPDLTVRSCSILTYNRDGQFPSYHFPVEAVLDYSAP